jgi:hypothetical protein
MPSSYTGNCLCGNVQYKFDGPLAPIQMCHCQQCRKAQGTAHVTNMPVDNYRFEITQGADKLREFESSAGKFRAFCCDCGSPLYSRRTDLPGVHRVRAGTINEDLDVPLAYHFFTADKANWWPITDNLPAFKQGA